MDRENKEKMTILYEDEHIVAIDKPSGVVVNKAASVSTETVQDWVEKQEWFQENNTIVDVDLLPNDFDPKYGTPEEIYAQRSGIAHRLDKATSGVLLIGKHPAVLLQLLKIFRERIIQKTYTCLVHGRLPEKKGIINVPIGRLRKNRQRFTVAHDGRQAITVYQVKSEYRNEKNELFSLVECYPKTGRTHQLRVHMKYLNCPIVADPWYLGKRLFKSDSQWCPRLFLHASRVEFVHPQTKEELTIVADLPEELDGVIEHLQKDKNE